MINLSDFDFTDLATVLMAFLLLLAIVFIRYLFISGAYHYIFYILLRRKYQDKIINDGPLKIQQLKREIWLSLLSAIIFAIIGVAALCLRQLGITGIYTDFSAFPIWYFPISILFFLAIHDTYYYWLHRWMHSSQWMRNFHMEHHKSLQTTVLTSFSFHPLESFLQAIIIPLILVVVPMSIPALLAVLVIMTLSATINHAGVEVYSDRIRYSWFKKWVIGATHHDAHHKYAQKNFGLYFTFWDRLMGTERKM